MCDVSYHGEAQYQSRELNLRSKDPGLGPPQPFHACMILGCQSFASLILRL